MIPSQFAEYFHKQTPMVQPICIFIAEILTTLVLPIGSIVIELIARPDVALIATIGKWIVFWGIGIRLIIAAISQISRPSFTTSILGLHDQMAEEFVSELGYANLSMGLIAARSVLAASWSVPAALARGLFLGLAGLMHWINRTARPGKIRRWRPTASSFPPQLEDRDVRVVAHAI